jgi:hypothetical protein
MAAGVAIMAAASSVGAEEPAAKGTVSVLVDGVGDVINSLVGSLLPDPRADIVEARSEYAQGWINFDFKLRQFSDPVKDRNWNSPATYAVWSLDTNSDSKADFLLEYGINDGALYGSVFPADAPAEAQSVCEADSVTYDKSGLYSMRLNPACINRPPKFAWSLEMSYDTNPADENAPAADDTVPGSGFSDAVWAPSTPISPLAVGSTSSTTAAAPPAAAPAAPAPSTPDAAVRTAPQTPPTTARAVPPAASPARPTATRPVGPGHATAPPATVTAPTVTLPATAPALADTGFGHLILARLGGALLAIGGLLILLGNRRQLPLALATACENTHR